LLGIASIILAIDHQDMNYSGIQSISIVLADEYKKLMFLAARQFRENYLFVRWGDLADILYHLF
jgi:hypothetical protein